MPSPQRGATTRRLPPLEDPPRPLGSDVLQAKLPLCHPPSVHLSALGAPYFDLFAEHRCEALFVSQDTGAHIVPVVWALEHDHRRHGTSPYATRTSTQPIRPLIKAACVHRVDARPGPGVRRRSTDALLAHRKERTPVGMMDLSRHQDWITRNREPIGDYPEIVQGKRGRPALAARSLIMRCVWQS